MSVEYCNYVVQYVIKTCNWLLSYKLCQEFQPMLLVPVLSMVTTACGALQLMMEGIRLLTI